jgi:hypothetical protein
MCVRPYRSSLASDPVIREEFKDAKPTYYKSDCSHIVQYYNIHDGKWRCKSCGAIL